MSHSLFDNTDELTSIYGQLKKFTYILTTEELYSLRAHLQLEIEERKAIQKTKDGHSGRF